MTVQEVTDQNMTIDSRFPPLGRGNDGGYRVEMRDVIKMMPQSTLAASPAGLMVSSCVVLISTDICRII